MSKKLFHKVIYKKRFVAFLDVMGFKELLGGDESSLNRLQEFYGQALSTTDFLKKKSAEGPFLNYGFQIIFVSDSIVLSIEVPEETDIAKIVIQEFFATIAYLQAILAFHSKIWIRGAVTMGNLHIDDDKNILVGPAFVRAYNLESTADFPRVIVDPLICAHFKMLPHQFIKEMNQVDNILLGAGSSIRWGGPIFMNDAVQIDWFYTALCIHDLNFVPFFDDLKNRMVLNQPIFFKSSKLLSYFRESLSSLPDHIKNDRTELMSEKLKEFGI